MRTFRAARAAARWLCCASITFCSHIVWLTRVVFAAVVWTTMVFGASFATIALNFPEGEWEAEPIAVHNWPLSAYARWTAVSQTDADDDDFWSGCIADRACVDRICSVDLEREQMKTDVADKVAGKVADIR